MLTPYTQSKFVEKILTSASGERFRVLFLVTLVNGEVKAQIVSAKPVNSKLAICSGSSDCADHSTSFTYQNSTLYLPAFCAKEKHNTLYIPSNAPEVSPYAELYFLTSQPTRAPAYK